MPKERILDLGLQKSQLDALRLDLKDLVRQVSGSREIIRGSQELLIRIDDMLANESLKP